MVSPNHRSPGPASQLPNRLHAHLTRGGPSVSSTVAGVALNFLPHRRLPFWARRPLVIITLAIGLAFVLTWATAELLAWAPS